jgi:DNA-directed RNA polymerase subunit RPC12/RpoP
MSNYYCKYCGSKASSVSSLTSASCLRHPNGANKGKHALYEGDEKSQYTCKNCGQKFSSLTGLTGASCLRHPDGANKGKHEPAL